MSFLLQNNFLYFNGYEICNFNIPFNYIKDIRSTKESLKSATKNPSNSYSSVKSFRKFPIKLTKNKFGVFHKITRKNLHSHIIFLSSKGTTYIFRNIVFNKLLNPIYQNLSTNIVLEIIYRTIDLILNQYKFDLIISDFNLKNLNKSNSINLINSNNITNIKIKLIIDMLLKEYNKIPLYILNKEILNCINLSNTDFDLNLIKDIKSVAIFSIQNPFFTGFLGKELRNYIEEVLPVCVFYHR